MIGNGRVLRQVTDAELERIDRGARDYARLTREYASATEAPAHAELVEVEREPCSDAATR